MVPGPLLASRIGVRGVRWGAMICAMLWFPLFSLALVVAWLAPVAYAAAWLKADWYWLAAIAAFLLWQGYLMRRDLHRLSYRVTRRLLRFIRRCDRSYS